jgi:hypothetical protein
MSLFSRPFTSIIGTKPSYRVCLLVASGFVGLLVITFQINNAHKHRARIVGPNSNPVVAQEIVKIGLNLEQRLIIHTEINAEIRNIILSALSQHESAAPYYIVCGIQFDLLLARVHCEGVRKLSQSLEVISCADDDDHEKVLKRVNATILAMVAHTFKNEFERLITALPAQHKTPPQVALNLFEPLNVAISEFCVGLIYSAAKLSNNGDVLIRGAAEVRSDKDIAIAALLY